MSTPVGWMRRRASNARALSPSDSKARLVYVPSATVMRLPGCSFTAATRRASSRRSFTFVPLAVTKNWSALLQGEAEAQGRLRVAQCVPEFSDLHPDARPQSVRQGIVRVRADAGVHQRAAGSIAPVKVLVLGQGPKR